MAGAGRRDADVDVLLSLGTAAGKRGARVVCDVPAAARDLVAELPGDQGLIRFRAPSWTGDPVSSDGRLAALRELAAGQDADAVRVLVGWCVGVAGRTLRPGLGRTRRRRCGGRQRRWPAAKPWAR
jgi:hypothetical protein